MMSKGEMIKLPYWPVTKQIVSWLYLDSHPVAEPWQSKDMINREYFPEVIERLKDGRN